MHLSAIDLNLLLVLHALFDTGSIEAAAARVHLSRSAFSHALARARAAIGDPIAVKAGRTLQLTPRGLALREPVRAAIAAAERAFSPSQEFDSRRAEQTFRIVAADAAMYLVLPHVLERLSREAPRLRLRIQAFTPGDELERVVSGDLHASIGVFTTIPNGLEQLPLFEDRYVCVFGAKHLLARKRRLTLADYAGARHLLVAPRAVPRTPIDTRLEELGHKRDIALTIPSFTLAPRLLAEFDLVVTIGARLATEFAARWPLCTRALPLEQAPFELALVWHRRLSADPAHRWLRACIAAAAGELGPPGNRALRSSRTDTSETVRALPQPPATAPRRSRARRVQPVSQE